MFNGVPKKLIIVGDKETDVYCEYLSMLISVKDDVADASGEERRKVGIEDGSIDTAIWTDDIYRDNRAHTSSRQKFVFIGHKGSAKNIIPNINFEQAGTEKDNDLLDDISIGVFYGWFGNKACIYIDDKCINEQDNYEKRFRKKYEELLKGYQAKVEESAKNKNAQKKALLMGGTGLLLGTPFLLPFVILEQRKAILTKQEILDQAYRYAVLKFYLKYLELFME